MKKIIQNSILTFALLLGVQTLFAQAKFEFEEEHYEFGDVKEGTIVEHSFNFKNVGDEDLQIIRVNASCGCTTPEWTMTPIKPGESGSIKVKFDSNNRVGIADKDIYIQSNAVLPNGEVGGRYQLKIKGNVLKN
ncbi:MAG TPA: DUF1573 domain-containing protein [Chitinophagaceae bacterium]|nr:DUF1573 domain-containing protein [Chitinophagaceae bacterium]